MTVDHMTNVSLAHLKFLHQAPDFAPGVHLCIQFPMIYFSRHLPTDSLWGRQRVWVEQNRGGGMGVHVRISTRATPG